METKGLMSCMFKRMPRTAAAREAMAAAARIAEQGPTAQDRAEAQAKYDAPKDRKQLPLGLRPAK